MRDTIKSHADFHTTDADPIARAEAFFVRAKLARFPTNARIGFLATERTFKLAVERNRAKRLLRDWVRFHEKLLAPRFDYIFIARRPILNTTRESGRAEMEKALTYIMHKYIPKNAKESKENS